VVVITDTARAWFFYSVYTIKHQNRLLVHLTYSGYTKSGRRLQLGERSETYSLHVSLSPHEVTSDYAFEWNQLRRAPLISDSASWKGIGCAGGGLLLA